MDSLRDLGLVVSGAGVGGLGVGLAWALIELRRIRKQVTTAASILAKAQEDARNRQLAILAACDLAQYVTDNFNAGQEIVKRIAPHLLKDRVE